MTLPFALTDIRKVTFFKRDEITTDLICCHIEAMRGSEFKTWFIHEEEAQWSGWLQDLTKLPEFDTEWYSKVSSPAFETCETVAYARTVA